ncbi:hypothetical protein FRACA_4230002 [Frankia canadensis]|uniref:Uncharacterized protein n=1 Tax=Frankia canadensis TaxID=1836972 RepID=A0A2I2KX48_9ACTN|nr:hypothetical protein FRACA_4230002 [Frankia canadensis]SOU57528.1 hypothetical protein FRACA_4230002 [Frankia canadensis]
MPPPRATDPTHLQRINYPVWVIERRIIRDRKKTRPSATTKRTCGTTYPVNAIPAPAPGGPAAFRPERPTNPPQPGGGAARYRGWPVRPRPASPLASPIRRRRRGR